MNPRRKKKGGDRVHEENAGKGGRRKLSRQTSNLVNEEKGHEGDQYRAGLKASNEPDIGKDDRAGTA